MSEFDPNFTGWLPANPPSHSKGINDAKMANADLSVRDRQARRVFISAAQPEDERVEPEKVVRRNFGTGPNAYASRRTRRED
jgi:hypothetical protein